MQIIPAIDIINGKCVRLFQGNFENIREYGNNPVEQAKAFANLGFEHLHLIDLDGARRGFPKNLRILEQIASETNLKVDFGGGLRTAQAIKTAVASGAWRVNLGSILAYSYREILNSIGDDIDKLIAAIDCKNGMVKANGWQKETNLRVNEFISTLVDAGIRHFTITDISRDGTLSSPAFELYDALRTIFPEVTLWASGGVGSISDIINLRNIGVDGVVVGRAIYENKVNPKELLSCLQNG